MWQKRNEVPAEAAATDAPAKRSRFGRPLRRCAAARPSPRPSGLPRPLHRQREADRMARTDANPPMPDFATDYVLQEVDPAYLTQSVKPKQFLHIDQAECILCEGCVDICPWKCIHMVSVDAIAEAVGDRAARRGPARPRGVHRRRGRLHPVRPLRRPLPDRVSSSSARSRSDVADGDPHTRTNRHGYSYGVRF